MYLWKIFIKRHLTNSVRIILFRMTTIRNESKMSITFAECAHHMCSIVPPSSCLSVCPLRVSLNLAEGQQDIGTANIIWIYGSLIGLLLATCDYFNTWTDWETFVLEDNKPKQRGRNNNSSGWVRLLPAFLFIHAKLGTHLRHLLPLS